MAQHAQMLRSLEDFKSSGRLRPYTPMAITLDKADGRLPLTAAEARSANMVFSSEVQEAKRVAVENRAHEIMAEMRDIGLRMQSAGLPTMLPPPPPQQQQGSRAALRPVTMGTMGAPQMNDGWGFAGPGGLPGPEEELEPVAAPSRRQSRAKRIATPELFNRLSIESASADWGNETTASIDDKWASLGLGDSEERRLAELLDAGCTRVLQVLDPGAAPPPPHALRAPPVAIAEPLMVEVEALLVAGDTPGAIAAQQQLVLRLAQRHLCARREGWVSENEVQDTLLLQQQVSQAVRWQVRGATSEAAVAAGLGAQAPQWLQQASDLTGERGLWEDDDVRRELRAAIFEAFSRTAASKGRGLGAQKWLRKATTLIDGMSIDMGARKLELGAAAHLNLCATLSVGKKHAEALHHALTARQQLLFRLGLSPELPDQLDGRSYQAMTDGWPRSKLPGLASSSELRGTVESIFLAAQRDNEDELSAPGSGTSVGQLLAAAYHNCAVQQEAIGEIPAGLSSVEVALALAVGGMFAGEGAEEVAQRKQYKRTHRTMRKAALAKPWRPPKDQEREQEHESQSQSGAAASASVGGLSQPVGSSDGDSDFINVSTSHEWSSSDDKGSLQGGGGGGFSDGPPVVAAVPAVTAVQSAPVIFAHAPNRRRQSRGQTRAATSQPRVRKTASGGVGGRQQLAPLNPGLIHKRQSLELFKTQGTLRPYTPDAIVLDKPLSTEPPPTPPKDKPANLSISADYFAHVLGLTDQGGFGRPNTAVVLEEAKNQVLREVGKREEKVAVERETTYRLRKSPRRQQQQEGQDQARAGAVFSGSPSFPLPTQAYEMEMPDFGSGPAAGASPGSVIIQHPPTWVNTDPWNKGPGQDMSRGEFLKQKKQAEEEEEAWLQAQQAQQAMAGTARAITPAEIAEWNEAAGSALMPMPPAGLSGSAAPGSPQATVSRDFTAKLLDDAYTASVLRGVFRRADRNGDGNLTRAELILRLRKDDELRNLLKLPKKISDAERDAFEAVFQGMDVDDSRGVTEEEFVAFLSTVVLHGAPAGTRSSTGTAAALADAPAALQIADGLGEDVQPQARARGGRSSPAQQFTESLIDGAFASVTGSASPRAAEARS